MSSDEDQQAPIAGHNEEDDEPDEIDDDEETDEEEEEEDDGEGELERNNNVMEEEEEDVDVEEVDRTISLSSLNSDPTRSVTIAVPAPDIPVAEAAAEIASESTAKRLRILEDEPIGELQRVNPNPPPSDDQARKLFQRLWTDEDEIGLLQGFLDHSTQRGSSQNNPHDTALFYDQIKSKLQLDFNKNQLVEKLRRLKKKYRNVLSRVSSGKEIQFKSPHDQATFEIACKIWGTAQNSQCSKDHIQQPQQQMRVADVDDDMPPNFNPASATNLNLNFVSNSNNFNSSGGYSNYHHSDRAGVDEWKSQQQQQKAKKRIRVKMEDIRSSTEHKAAVATNSSPSQIPIWGPPGTNLTAPSLVEEIVKNRISPLMYDIKGNRGYGGLGDGIVRPVPLSFASPVNAIGTDATDDRWRKQQILELEVYSKRLELVQEQIKLTLEQLRSTGS
uniref:Glabrous enhancer-binding protein-like DBD domain-containing protein n=1 Tax=Kalanchoe fedtschenkoi TaxID=63787 RepID=A0A7N0TJ11_KALFE